MPVGRQAGDVQLLLSVELRGEQQTRERRLGKPWASGNHGNARDDSGGEHMMRIGTVTGWAVECPV